MFMFLCFFELASVFFCWQDADVRQTDVYFFEVCFLCFLCIWGCQKLPIGGAWGTRKWIVVALIVVWSVGGFSPRGVANSQFWRRSRTRKWGPHATTLPTPWARGMIWSLRKRFHGGQFCRTWCLTKLAMEGVGKKPDWQGWHARFWLRTCGTKKIFLVLLHSGKFSSAAHSWALQLQSCHCTFLRSLSHQQAE